MDLTNLNKERKTRRKPALDIGTMMYGKIPPQAKDLEEAILGAMMVEKTAFDVVAEILKPECFYVEANQRVYRAIQYLQQSNSPVDILTVTEELKRREELDLVGGAYYVLRLTNCVVSGAHIEAHSRIVIQKYIQREVIRIGGEMIGEAYEDSTDVFDLLDKVEQDVFGITAKNIKSNYEKVGAGLYQIYNRLDELRHREIRLTGVPTGFRDLDRVTSGWQSPDLIILAARPSVGKTALALNLARNAASYPDKPTAVGFFSLEMSMKQCRERLLSASARINLSKITCGDMSDEDMKLLYEQGIQPVDALPIFIDDTGGLSVYQLRSKARSMINKHGVGLIIIDYLQLMGGIENARYDNRNEEIRKISGSLKNLAKEVGVPIICLSQLSRETEKRKPGDQMPKMADLRDSGAIEQDADLVMALYRPEYHGIHSNDKGESTKGETHLNIIKHRNGPLELIKLTAKLHIQKFVEFEYLAPAQQAAAFGSVPVASSFIPVKDDNGEEYSF